MNASAALPLLALLLLVAACADSADPAPPPASEVTTDAVPAPDAEPSERGPLGPVDEWVDPARTKVLELPPNWKAAGMPLEMLNPHLARERAPETFRVRFDTTKGDITIECVRSWAPRGVDRFYNLVKLGFYDNVAVYRVVEDHLIQFGIHGNIGVSRAWHDAPIADDPIVQSNRRGYVCMAKKGLRPNSRTTELMIHLDDNPDYDSMGFVPIGRVLSGLRVAGKMQSKYGNRVLPKTVRLEGNPSIRDRYPELDWVRGAELLADGADGGASVTGPGEGD